MAKRKYFNFTSILSYILILFFVVGIVGFIVYFTNGFTTDFTSFYLSVDGKNVLQDTSNVSIFGNYQLNIKVKYTMGFANENLKGYSFDLKANPDVNFAFSVDGAMFSFQDEFDWTKCFEIEQDENNLVLSAKANKLSDLLKLACVNQNVELLNDASEYIDGDLFLLTLHSYNKKSSITLGLHIEPVCEKISLDTTEIIF